MKSILANSQEQNGLMTYKRKSRINLAVNITALTVNLALLKFDSNDLIATILNFVLSAALIYSLYTEFNIKKEPEDEMYLAHINKSADITLTFVLSVLAALLIIVIVKNELTLKLNFHTVYIAHSLVMIVHESAFLLIERAAGGAYEEEEE